MVNLSQPESITSASSLRVDGVGFLRSELMLADLLLLGVDREQTQFSDRGFNANHPAVHKAIAELIKTANEGGIECSICGLAPVEYPNPINLLIQWGITTISVEPDAVDRTYRAIARAERRMLLKSPSPLYKGRAVSFSIKEMRSRIKQ